MLGFFRFILAGLVAWSNTPLYPGSIGVQIGASAVIAFYFISGFLMAKTYPRFFGQKNPFLLFYTDRFIRLYPIFFLFFIISTLYYFYLSNHDFSKTNLVGELLLIPQNYHYITDRLTNHMIDPAWSLGAEFQWYLLVPLIFFLTTQGRRFILIILFLGQILVFSLYLFPIDNDSCEFLQSHTFNLCFPLSDLLGYRLLIFVGATFLFGHIMSELLWRKRVFVIIAFSLFFFIIWLLTTLYGKILPRFNDVMFAYVFIFPLCLFTLKKKIENKLWQKIDKLCAGLSYPVFLTHFLSIRIASDLGNPIGLTGRYLDLYQIIVAGFVTLLFSLFLFLIQQKIDKFRINLRGFSSLNEKHNHQVISK